MPYYSPHASSIASLILAKGQAQADADLRASSAWENAAKSYGDIIGGSIASMAKYQAEAPHRQLQGLQVRAGQRAEEADLATKSAWDDAGGDADTAVELLGQRGHGEEAMALKEKLAAARLTALHTQSADLENAGRQLHLASQLLPMPPDKVDDPKVLADFSAEYATRLPQVQKVLGPDMSTFLPTPDDPDLVNKVRRAHDFGMTLAEKVAMRKDAVALANEALKFDKDSRERDEYYTKSVGQYLSTIGSDNPDHDQQEWMAVLKMARFQGASPATLAKFGDAFSADAAKKAGVLALTPKESYDVTHPELVKGTSEAADAFRILRAGKESELGRKLNQDEIDSVWEKAVTQTKSASEPLVPVLEGETVVWRARKNAEGKPVGSATATPPGMVSEVTRRDAETWRANKMDALDKERRRGGEYDLNVATGKYEQVPVMDDKAYAAQKARIETDYKRMLVPARPARAPGAPPVTPPPAAPPVKASTPTVTPPPAKTPTADGAVPDAVQKLLAGQKAGEYEMTDGTKWVVAKDGTITKSP